MVTGIDYIRYSVEISPAWSEVEGYNYILGLSLWTGGSIYERQHGYRSAMGG